jgi:uncharacterized membrane protein YciS (DUF1049 family)
MNRKQMLAQPEQTISKLLTRSLLLGFGLGALLLALSTLGLVIAFLEFLRPVLIPGVNLTTAWLSTSSTSNLILAGFAMNGTIFSILLFCLMIIRQKIEDKNKKTVASLAVVLGFLLLTGMLPDIYSYIISPDKSWIFRVGA